MALEVECAGICPACGSWDALWRGVGIAGDTTYLFIDCDVCDPPPSWLRARLDRWAA
jgi:hypothetical protein